MIKLLEIRQRLKLFYREYERSLSKIACFLFAFLVFYFINLNVGLNQILQNPLVAILLALVCALTPSARVISSLMCLCILLQFQSLSTEMAVSAACVFLMMFLFYYMFKGEYSWVMPMATFLCILNIPGTFVIALGLMASPVVAVPASFGILTYRMMEMVRTEYGTLFSQTESFSSIQKVAWFFQGLFQDETQLLLIAATIVTVLIVYAIRRLPIDYAWAAAIAVGAISYLLIMLLGNFALDIHVEIGMTLLNAIVGVLVGLILYLFVFAVDYTRTEYAQFEDEEYYYYVKAVPKISVTVPDKKIKHITEKTNSNSTKEESTN